MFGEGNNTKLIEDIVNSVTKVDKALGASLGISVQEIITSFMEKAKQPKDPNMQKSSKPKDQKK